MYLVEKVDRLDYRAVGQDRFEAAILHTQIVDGLCLRHTSGMEETLRFLIAMTATITAGVTGRPLRACIMHYPVLKEPYLTRLGQDNQLSLGSCFQSYGCHAQINSKSANLTVRNVFTRQLLAVRGITAEKALAITARFPSLMSLWRHYQDLPGDDKAKAAHFKDLLIAGDQQRKLGAALSQKLYHLVCATTYKDPS